MFQLGLEMGNQSKASVWDLLEQSLGFVQFAKLDVAEWKEQFASGHGVRVIERSSKRQLLDWDAFRLFGLKMLWALGKLEGNGISDHMEDWTHVFDAIFTQGRVGATQSGQECSVAFVFDAFVEPFENYWTPVYSIKGQV